jgi:hypothetical protein
MIDALVGLSMNLLLMLVPEALSIRKDFGNYVLICRCFFRKYT